MSLGKTPNAVSHLGSSLTKDMQTQQILCWSGMTDTDHSTTSHLNKEANTYSEKLYPEQHGLKQYSIVCEQSKFAVSPFELA